MRVLDIATFDGFWAFEFERRGAEVVAADIASWSDVDIPRRMVPYAGELDLDRPTGEGFRLAHEILGSKVERLESSVYDLDPERDRQVRSRVHQRRAVAPALPAAGDRARGVGVPGRAC